MSENWKRGNWWEDAILKRTSPPYGPINTVSNAAYLVAGGAVWYLHGALVLALALCFLGLASGAYHAFKCSWLAAADEAGMYAVLGYLVVPEWYVALSGIVFGMLRWKPGWFRDVNLTHSIGLIFLLATFRAGLAAWPAVLAFGLAYAVWNVGKAQKDNDNDPATVPWYARYCHGVWHIVTAAGFYLLYVAGV